MRWRAWVPLYAEAQRHEWQQQQACPMNYTGASETEVNGGMSATISRPIHTARVDEPAFQRPGAFVKGVV